MTGSVAGPRRAWVAALVTATVGVAVGWFGPIQILLPAQAAALSPDGGKEALLALVTGTGAAISMIANPLWGAASDRLRLRTGSRMPILVAGLVIGVVGLAVLAVADTAPVMVTGWALTQFGLNGPFAVLAALIADRVPDERRGLVGSLFGVAQLIGTVVGTALAVALGEGALGYVAVAVAVPLLVLPILLTKPGGPELEAPQGADTGILRSVRIDRPFVAAFALRFLLNLVAALGLLYLYFFLSDRAGVDDPGTWMLILTVCYVVVAGATAAVAGPLSDRIRSRKVPAAAASIVLAVGSTLLAFSMGMPLVVTAVLVLGVGYGLFLAIDIAVVTEALPDPATRATLLGVANVGSSLPQVLAPVVAAPIVLSAGGYPALYVGAAIVALLALPVLPFLGRTSSTPGE